MKKTILISIDGMRPDGLKLCGNPYVEVLKEKSSYTFNAQTVFPSVTLPCHMSMFHSVPPERHGTMTNMYTINVHPISGLFEELARNHKSCAMYYGWEPIREIGRPGSLVEASFCKARAFDDTDDILTDRAIAFIKEREPDFVFLYLVETDEKGGHDTGWMSDTYLSIVSRAIDCVKRVMDAVGDTYTVIVTADHGGHDRSHGTDMPEDMLIPMFFCGEDFEGGKALENVSILDIAPTIVDVMGIIPPVEWEGKSVLKK